MTDASVELVIFISVQGFVETTYLVDQIPAKGAKRNGVHFFGLSGESIKSVTHTERVAGRDGDGGSDPALTTRLDLPNTSHIPAQPGIQRFLAAGEIVRPWHTMRIKAYDGCAFGGRDGRIKASGDQPFRIINDLQGEIGVRLVKTGDLLPGAIGGKPVGNDDFQMGAWIILVIDRRKKLRDSALFIEARDDNADPRHDGEPYSISGAHHLWLHGRDGLNFEKGPARQRGHLYRGTGRGFAGEEFGIDLVNFGKVGNIG